MRAPILLTLTFSFLLLFVSASDGQIINVYSVIDYDASTNTLDGLSYTQPSYQSAAYYSVTVGAAIYDDSNYVYGSQLLTEYNGSWARVELIVPGNGHHSSRSLRD